VTGLFLAPGGPRPHRSSSTRCSSPTAAGGTRTSPTRLRYWSASRRRATSTTPPWRPGLIRRLEGRLGAADVERNLELFGEGWMIVPITAVQLRDPQRLVGLMARIIAFAGARRA